MGLKNSASGPIWAVSQAELFNELFREKVYLDGLLLQLPKVILEAIDQAREDGINIPDDAPVLIEEQLHEIKKMAQIWQNLYHGSVLLHAAVNPPGRKVLNFFVKGAETISAPDPYHEYKKHIMENGYETPAWSPSEENEEGWLGYEGPEDRLDSKVTSNFDLVGELVSHLGDIIHSDLQQDVKIDNERLPALHYFLQEVKPYQTFGNGQVFDLAQFDPIMCLKICRQLITLIEGHQISERHINEAIFRVAKIWNDDIPHNFIEELDNEPSSEFLESWADQVKTRLGQVLDWLNSADLSDTNNFKEWLADQHAALFTLTGSGRNLLQETIDGDIQSAKWTAAAMVAMLRSNGNRSNGNTLKLIYDRCFNLDNVLPFPGLGETIKDLVNRVPDNGGEEELYKSQWRNLRFATFGIITWHIFHQVTPAANRIQHLIIGE